MAQVEQLLDEVKEKKIREAAKEAAASYQPTSGSWISTGLVVKVMAEQLPAYYKQKGEVVGIVDQYVAEVEMMQSGDVLRIDQSQLETVRFEVFWSGCIMHTARVLSPLLALSLQLKR